MPDIKLHSQDEFFAELLRRRETVAGRVAEACVLIQANGGTATDYWMRHHHVAGAHSYDEVKQLMVDIVKAGRGLIRQNRVGTTKAVIELNDDSDISNY